MVKKDRTHKFIVEGNHEYKALNRQYNFRTVVSEVSSFDSITCNPVGLNKV